MSNRSKNISGLLYIEQYIEKVEHDYLLDVIDQQPWISDLKRRVQHYGYRYDYRRRTVGTDMFLGPLPLWAGEIAERLQSDGFIAQVPDQLIVNEYQPGQGIASHIDCVPCFGETILSLSLGSACVMRFTHSSTDHSYDYVLEPQSLLMLNGEARYTWAHGILARKQDIYHNRRIPRGRRVSLT